MTETAMKMKKHLRAKFLLFVTMLLFKSACDLGLFFILRRDAITYRFDFNELKFINGLLCCTVLFFAVRHEKHKVSVFMLYMVYLMQIIPITTIYAFCNKDAVYYNMLCFSFFVCEIAVQWISVKNMPHLLRNPRISFLMRIVFLAVLIGTIVSVVWKNGMFSLTALNIYKVYELRSSGSFVLGRYMQYLFHWVMAVILPFFIAKKMNDKKYISVCVLCALVITAYLYSGFKSYLFCLPVILITSVWARRRNFYQEIFNCACLGFFVLVLLTCFSPVLEVFFTRIYSLFGSRMLIIPANNKFSYFDFFSRNPKMGLGGIFPRWLIPIPNNYENIRYTFLISALYYGQPEMNSNTGFLAEGYMRFGHIGTLLVLLVFAVLLKMMDSMQKRAGYAFTAGAFVYPVLTLTDAHLIDQIFFGSWLFIILILLLYTHVPVRKLKYCGIGSLWN